MSGIEEAFRFVEACRERATRFLDWQNVTVTKNRATERLASDFAAVVAEVSAVRSSSIMHEARRACGYDPSCLDERREDDRGDYKCPTCAFASTLLEYYE